MSLMFLWPSCWTLVIPYEPHQSTNICSLNICCTYRLCSWMGGTPCFGDKRDTVLPITCHAVREGKKAYSSTLYLTLAVDVGEWLMPCPSATLGFCQKSRPHQDSIPRPSSPKWVSIPTKLSQISAQRPGSLRFGMVFLIPYRQMLQ
jgi:hypothetical protein